MDPTLYYIYKCEYKGDILKKRSDNKNIFQTKKPMLTTECTRNLLICFMWVLKNADQVALRQWWNDLNVGVLNQILDVLYYAISNFEYRVRFTEKLRPVLYARQ